MNIVPSNCVKLENWRRNAYYKHIYHPCSTKRMLKDYKHVAIINKMKAYEIFFLLKILLCVYNNSFDVKQ